MDYSIGLLDALDPLFCEHTFQTFDDTKKNPKLAKIKHGMLSECREYLESMNKSGAGIYFTVNETDGTGRKKSNITRVRALYVDYDEPDPDRKFEYELPPSYVVESSPGKHHVYWLLSDELPLDEFDLCQKALISEFDTDPKVFGVERVMRVPGFLHKKGAPFLVRELIRTDIRYTAAELREWVRSFRKAPIVTEEYPSEGDEVLEAVSGDEWDAMDFQIRVERLAQAHEGERNNLLNTVAFRAFELVKAGKLDKKEVTQQLQSTALSIGLVPGEITATLRSAWKSSKAALVVDYVDVEEVEAKAEVKTELELEYPPGVTGDIARYIYSASRKPGKAYAIAGALTTVGYLNDNRAYIAGEETALNPYICLVGKTGQGKDDPRKIIKRLVDCVEAELKLGGGVYESMASGAALLSNLARHPSLLLLMDEFGLYLQSCRSDQGGGHKNDLMDSLMQLSTMGRDFYGKKGYADTKKTADRVNHPYVNLICTTTRSSLLEGIDASMIDSGLLNRIIFVQDNGYKSRNRNLGVPISDELKEKLASLHTDKEPGLVFDDDAAGLLLDIEPGIEKLEQGPLGSMWGRAREQVLRISGILAIGDGWVVRKSHVSWAWDFIQRTTRDFIDTLRADLSENSFQKDLSKALNFISNAKVYSEDRAFDQYCSKGIMPRGKLIKLMKMPAKQVDTITENLALSLQIKICVSSSDKRVVLYLPRNEGALKTPFK